MRSLKLLGVLCIIIISGCASTELTYVYKSGDYAPASFKKMAVIGIFPNTHARVEIENAVVESLKAKGIHAITTWSIFPMAHDTELIKQAGFTGEKRKEIIRQKVTENNIDAVLVITLFDSRKETRYVPGTSTAVGIGVGAPVYGYPYAAYFGYAWEVTSQPGYYEDASTYFLESNLYDIASEKLLWTGQTRTDMASNLQTEAEKFSNVVVSRLIADSQAQKK
jgi:hypothetical protein